MLACTSTSRKMAGFRRSSPNAWGCSPFSPVGRSAQAAVCKTGKKGAIPLRDSNFISSISVERYTLVAVRKDLPSRNTGRDTLMLDHFPSESGASAETPHGQSNGWRPGSVRLGFHFRDAKSRCRRGLHRPGRGGSTPPSRRVRVASIAAMQRSLKPQSTGQHRGDPPVLKEEAG
jgi:hypothetical protein